MLRPRRRTTTIHNKIAGVLLPLCTWLLVGYSGNNHQWTHQAVGFVLLVPPYCSTTKNRIIIGWSPSSRNTRRRKRPLLQSLPPQVNEDADDDADRIDPGRLSASEDDRQYNKKFILEDDDDDTTGDNDNIQIPSTGISVSDEMEAAQEDRFVTEVLPLDEEGLPGVAQLVTKTLMTGSFEPIRYLVALSSVPPLASEQQKQQQNDATTTINGGGGKEEMENDDGDCASSTIVDYVLVDIPPYSPQLVTRIQAYMSGRTGGSRLVAMLVTSRDAIHYDDAPSVYTTRRTDLELWKRQFPNISIVAYRLDIPRDCRHAITQVLDGYGPFAWNGTAFVETGRPLQIVEWDYDVAEDVLSGSQLPPDDDNDEGKHQEDKEYTPEAIRKREEDKSILAIYTPGHSFGSVSYIFPKTGLCCSGFTIPAEDTREEENLGTGTTGPFLDSRGYITTSRDIRRQMDSAKFLVETYGDRFHVVLPSRGDPLLLGGPAEDRIEVLLGNIEQYRKIGEIYQQLGIVSSDGGDDDDNDGAADL